MATSREQELAKDMVVAWLNYLAAVKGAPTDLGDTTPAAQAIASMYRVLVQAIEETSTPAPGGPPAI
jgi:hypothetical protein